MGKEERENPKNVPENPNPKF